MKGKKASTKLCNKHPDLHRSLVATQSNKPAEGAESSRAQRVYHNVESLFKYIQTWVDGDHSDIDHEKVRSWADRLEPVIESLPDIKKTSKSNRKWEKKCDDVFDELSEPLNALLELSKAELAKQPGFTGPARPNPPSFETDGNPVSELPALSLESQAKSAAGATDNATYELSTAPTQPEPTLSQPNRRAAKSAAGTCPELHFPALIIVLKNHLCVLVEAASFFDHLEGKGIGRKPPMPIVGKAAELTPIPDQWREWSARSAATSVSSRSLSCNANACHCSDTPDFGCFRAIPARNKQKFQTLSCLCRHKL